MYFRREHLVSRIAVGQPIGYFYGFETNGIIQNQTEADAWVGQKDYFLDDQRPGDVRFVDQNNDGAIDDKTECIWATDSDFELGLQLNARGKASSSTQHWLASWSPGDAFLTGRC